MSLPVSALFFLVANSLFSFSPALLKSQERELISTLEKGEQAILFLNRRGNSRVIGCGVYRMNSRRAGSRRSLSPLSPWEMMNPAITLWHF